MNKILVNYEKIINQIDLYKSNISSKYSPPNLIAVSKTFPVEVIQILLNHGHTIFGENKVQEAKQKWTSLKLREKEKNIELHLIGPLQSNKVNAALEIFDVIQTLDREKIAIRINNFLEKNENSSSKKFMIQVNVGDEDQKSGIHKKSVVEFVDWCQNDMKINIIGLMCIPPISQDSRQYFQELRSLCDRCNLEHASMGMSSDFEQALKEGSTYLRVGTGIFGSRS